MDFTFFIHYLVVEMYRAEESLSLALMMSLSLGVSRFSAFVHTAAATK